MRYEIFNTNIYKDVQALFATFKGSIVLVTEVLCLVGFLCVTGASAPPPAD